MGASDNSGRIARQQEQQEQQRLAAIKQGIGGVNAVYDSPERQAQINDYLEANRKLYFDELAKQQGDATRQTKFALARNGTAGSRQQIDAAADMGEAHNKGVINADRQAQGAANNLRMSDEDSRNNLIALVQSGLDATTASQRANSTLRVNLEGAKSGMGVDALGQVFGGFSDLYKRSKDRDEERRAYKDLGTIYGTAGQWGYGGGK